MIYIYVYAVYAYVYIYICIYIYIPILVACIILHRQIFLSNLLVTRATPKDRNETRCDTLPARARERGSSEIVGFPLGVAFLLFLKNSWA